MADCDLQQFVLDNAAETVQGIADSLRRIAENVERSANRDAIARDPNAVLSAVANDVLWGVANIGLGSLANTIGRVYQAREER